MALFFFLYSYKIYWYTICMQEVRHHGFLSRLFSSFVGVGVGFLLFIGSFFVLWINEGAQKDSVLVESASVVSISDVSPATPLVAVVGPVGSSLSAQGEVIDTSSFVALDRFAEMYAWVQTKYSEEDREFGGGATETITYSYDMRWEERPLPSSQFAEPQGHENPQVAFSSTSFRPSTLRLDGVALSSIPHFPHLPAVSLAPALLLRDGVEIVEGGKYVFISRDGSSTYSSPKVGDTRLSFSGIRDGALVTVVGGGTSAGLARYVGEQGDIFALYAGGYEEALATARSLDSTRLWIFRGLGFFMMFFGLLLISGPFSILLDIVPFLGTASRFLTFLSSLLVALALSVITILVSILAHSVWLLVATLVAVLCLAFYLNRRRSGS